MKKHLVHVVCVWLKKMCIFQKIFVWYDKYKFFIYIYIYNTYAHVIYSTK